MLSKDLEYSTCHTYKQAREARREYMRSEQLLHTSLDNPSDTNAIQPSCDTYPPPSAAVSDTIANVHFPRRRCSALGPPRSTTTMDVSRRRLSDASASITTAPRTPAPPSMAIFFGPVTLPPSCEGLGKNLDPRRPPRNRPPCAWPDMPHRRCLTFFGIEAKRRCIASGRGPKRRYFASGARRNPVRGDGFGRLRQ